MVVVGIQPDVAVALARLGLKLEAVATPLDIDAGLAYLKTKARAPDHASDPAGKRPFEQAFYP